MPAPATAEMPSPGQVARLRQRVETVLRSPWDRVDHAIRTLEPTYTLASQSHSRKIETALAQIAGEGHEAPLSSDRRDAAARVIQRSWRLSRSRRLLARLIADLVDMEVLSRRAGGRGLMTHLDERTKHLKSVGTVLDILAAHGEHRPAAQINALIETLDGDSKRARELFPKCTTKQLDALIRGMVFLSNQARVSYRVQFSKGLLLWRGKALDTSIMTSHWSGRGAAIFVMDGEGTFYAAEQCLHDFHHSSFLAGAPVFGAGEMQVQEGQLQVLSAQSGHYRPTTKELLQTLNQLVRNGVREYQLALWCRTIDDAQSLRKRFAQAQSKALNWLPPAPAPDTPVITSPYVNRENEAPQARTKSPSSNDPLLVHVPARIYLFDPQLQKDLLLFNPDAPD